MNKKVIELIENEFNEIKESISYAIGDKSAKYKILCQSIDDILYTIKQLLTEEGKEVDLKTKYCGYETVEYDCPSCDESSVTIHDDYCSKCGQKLIWPESDK